MTILVEMDMYTMKRVYSVRVRLRRPAFRGSRSKTFFSVAEIGCVQCFVEEGAFHRS